MRFVLLGAGLVILFAVVVVIVLQFYPEPRSEADYLVIGSIGTFVTLGALFVALNAISFRSKDTFFKKRPKSE